MKPTEDLPGVHVAAIPGVHDVTLRALPREIILAAIVPPGGIRGIHLDVAEAQSVANELLAWIQRVVRA